MRPRSRISRERLEDDVDDLRREPERRLVEQEQVGARDEGAARSRAAAAARPRARPRGRRRNSLHDRKQLVDGLRCPPRPPSPRAPAGEAEPEVLLDASARRRCAAPRGRARCRDRATRSGDAAEQRAAGEPDLARVGGDEAHDRVQQSSTCPAPFGPIRPTISPRPHLERDAAHGGDAAVADVEVLDLEHGRVGQSTASASWTALSPR